MGQMQAVGKYRTTIKTTNGETAVTYFQATVVIFSEKEITLNTGGYYTFSTKARMNQASNQFELGYQVYQKGGTRRGGCQDSWYVNYQGKTYQFDDNDQLVLVR